MLILQDKPQNDKQYFQKVFHLAKKSCIIEVKTQTNPKGASELTTNITIAPGVTLRALYTDKFKTGCFSINFLRPHCAQDAAVDALLPSVLLRATEKYPDIRSISTRLDELYGASFGTLVRRKGESKLVGFYADFIEDAFLPEGEEVFAPMVEFAQEVLFHPFLKDGCFVDRFVEGEKQNLINAIESNLNNKRSYATKQMLSTMCAEEAYGVPRLGYAEDVKKITAQSLWEHYQEVLRTSKIEIFYAGRQSAQSVAKAFASVFSREETEFVTTKTKIITAAKEIKEISEALDVTQGKLVIGLRTGITGADADYPALMLLNAVYGAGMTSKLFVNVREKLSLCYYASSSIDKYKGIMIISSGISFENYDVAKNAILNELEACKRGEISGEELETARSQVLSALRMSLDAAVRLDDFYIGMAVMETMDIPQLMQEISKLTVEDLAQAARKITTDTIYFLKGESA